MHSDAGSDMRRPEWSLQTAHTGGCVQAREQSLLLSDGGEPTTQDGEVMFIWGTNIHLTTLQARLRRFFSNFTGPGADQPKYMELMSQVRCQQGCCAN